MPRQIQPHGSFILAETVNRPVGANLFARDPSFVRMNSHLQKQCDALSKHDVDRKLYFSYTLSVAQRGDDRRGGRAHAAPDIKRFGSLFDQHAETVGDYGGAVFARKFHERRLAPVHHVVG